MGCSTVETGRSLDKCWALSRPSDAQRLWGSMRQWAGLDARLLHDDWMICLRPNPFLIDSEMSQSAILKYHPLLQRLLSFTFSCSGLIRRLYRSPATLSFLKMSSVVFEDSLLSIFLFTNEQLWLGSFSLSHSHSQPVKQWSHVAAPAASKLHVMADSMNVVDQILARPFDSLPYEEKIRVKQQSRSTPKIDLVLKVGERNRSFQHSWYDKVSWLTGSAVK